MGELPEDVWNYHIAPHLPWRAIQALTCAHHTFSMIKEHTRSIEISYVDSCPTDKSATTVTSEDLLLCGLFDLSSLCGIYRDCKFLKSISLDIRHSVVFDVSLPPTIENLRIQTSSKIEISLLGSLNLNSLALVGNITCLTECTVRDLHISLGYEASKKSFRYSSFSGVESLSVEYFSGFGNLSFSSIFDDTIFKTLRKLSLNGLLFCMTRSETLEELTIANCPVSEVPNGYTVPELKILRLSNIAPRRWGEKAINESKFRSYSNLEHLELHNNVYTDRKLVIPAQARQLRSLTIGKGKNKPATVIISDKLVNLQIVHTDLSKNKITQRPENTKVKRLTY